VTSLSQRTDDQLLVVSEVLKRVPAAGFDNIDLDLKLLDIHAGPHRGSPLIVILPPLEVLLEVIEARLELDLPPIVLGRLDLHHLWL
jgi:hypothetical protein